MSHDVLYHGDWYLISLGTQGATRAFWLTSEWMATLREESSAEGFSDEGEMGNWWLRTLGVEGGRAWGFHLGCNKC